MKTQRLSINAIVRLGNLVLDGLITLVVVSYFVRRLGAEAYGLVPWLASLFGFFTIVSTAVQTAAGRFVTFASGQGDRAAAQGYFSVSLVLLAGFGAAGLLVTGFLAWLAPALFPFPLELIPSARGLALLLGGAVCLDIAAGGLYVGYFARQRFDLEFGVMMISGLLRVALILALSEARGPSLIWIGVGTLAGAALRVLGALFFVRRLLPGISFAVRRWNAPLVRPLLTFAGEVGMAGVGMVILNQADILVAGWLLGPAAVTVYFCGAKWNLLVRAVIGSFSTVMIPRFTTLQAENRLGEIRALAVRANRLIMPLGWLLAALLFAFSRPLILTWVGPGQAEAIAVLRVIAFPMAVTVSAYVMISVLTGIGKIRESSLSALAAALASPALAVYAVVEGNLGVVGVALGSSICLVIRNGAYIPILARRYAGIPLRHYYRELAQGALAVLPSFAVGLVVAGYARPVGWVKLTVAMAACSIPTLAVWWFVVADPEDRRLLKNLLPFSDRGPSLRADIS